MHDDSRVLHYTLHEHAAATSLLALICVQALVINVLFSTLAMCDIHIDKAVPKCTQNHSLFCNAFT